MIMTSRWNRTAIVLWASVALAGGAIWAAAEPDFSADVQLRAMSDELARAKTLHLNNLDKPYFISFSSDDTDVFTVNASLGGLLSSSRRRLREPHITVRVGDSKLDNTGSIYSQYNPNAGSLPVDDNYAAFRNVFWLATDRFYKRATEDITRKRSVLREVSDPDTTADFSAAPPVHLLTPLTKLKIDETHWTKLVRQLSARLQNYPDIYASHVNLRAIDSTFRLVNTEGTVLRTPEQFSDLQIRTATLLPDGTTIWNHTFLCGTHPSDLPPETQLKKAVDETAAETQALIKAPAAEEYAGPVLFEGQASPEMLAQILDDAVRILRKPVTPPSNPVPLLDSVWASRLGMKVTPDWMTIVDDPSATEFHGTLLLGHFLVDDEGVAAQRVVLVEKGTLKGFLLTRQPVRTFSGSNGHGRLPGLFGARQPVIGNMLVTVDQSSPEAEMKQKLLAMVKSAGLKYGMLIRKMDFPSSAPLSVLERTVKQMQGSGVSRSISMPLLAYRVYPDGHEELVRGVRFKEFSAKDLRTVAAASDRQYVLNYVNNGSRYDWIDAPGSATISSVVAPSLLFESVELDKTDDQKQKPPLAPPPALTAQK